jgi:tRNA (Thr-GGU) A37 N-methylase
MPILVEPIAHVICSRTVADDDGWNAETARIELVEGFEQDALAGLVGFSHIEVLYHFHGAQPAGIVRGARHPRGIRPGPPSGYSRNAARTVPIVWG